MLERALPFEAAATGYPAPPILPLEARGLVFEAGGRRLIDGLDLTLRQGLRTVIVGPNGAGKSLTLRLLHGLLQPSAGEVLWGGRPADQGIRQRQAMVFQQPVLLRRSAAGNIGHALRARRLSAEVRTSRSQQVLELAGLLPLARSPARRLSGGEQQRLAMARALSLGPEVLFLDEPSAHLDPGSTLAIEHLIERAHAAGTKVVLVTHDLGQARRLAHDVVFLDRGRVLEHSPAERFFARPASAAAEAFLAGRLVL